MVTPAATPGGQDSSAASSTATPGGRSSSAASPTSSTATPGSRAASNTSPVGHRERNVHWLFEAASAALEAPEQGPGEWRQLEEMTRARSVGSFPVAPVALQPERAELTADAADLQWFDHESSERRRSIGVQDQLDFQEEAAIPDQLDQLDCQPQVGSPGHIDRHPQEVAPEDPGSDRGSQSEVVAETQAVETWMQRSATLPLMPCTVAASNEEVLVRRVRSMSASSEDHPPAGGHGGFFSSLVIDATGGPPEEQSPSEHVKAYLRESSQQLRSTRQRLEGQVALLEDWARGLDPRGRAEESQQALSPKSAAAAAAGPLVEHLPYAQDQGALEVGSLQQQLLAVQQVKEALHQENLELQKRLRERELKEAEGHQAQSACVVCLSHAANIVCLPCKHLALCGPCSGHGDMTSCPICRIQIDQLMQIFTP